MPSIDQAAIAINAAGIADAFGSVHAHSKIDEGRFEALTEQYQGWVGVMMQIAEAGEIMERYRVKHGANAKWGADLPYLYDVWDFIADAIWAKLGSEPLEQLVESAIQKVACTEAR